MTKQTKTMEQCKLCKLGLEEVRWIDNSKQIAMGRNADGVYELLTVEDGMYGSHRYVTELNFCPTCGRRLNEGLVEDVSIDAPKPSVEDVVTPISPKTAWLETLSEELQQEYADLLMASFADAWGKRKVVTLKGNGETRFETLCSTFAHIGLNSLIEEIEKSGGDISIEVNDPEGYVDPEVALKEFEVKHGFNEER